MAARFGSSVELPNIIRTSNIMFFYYVFEFIVVLQSYDYATLILFVFYITLHYTLAAYSKSVSNLCLMRYVNCPPRSYTLAAWTYQIAYFSVVQ